MRNNHNEQADHHGPMGKPNNTRPVIERDRPQQLVGYGLTRQNPIQKRLRFDERWESSLWCPIVSLIDPDLAGLSIQFGLLENHQDDIWFFFSFFFFRRRGGRHAAGKRGNFESRILTPLIPIHHGGYYTKKRRTFSSIRWQRIPWKISL